MRDPKAFYEIECPICKGSGKYKPAFPNDLTAGGIPCAYCEGKGTVQTCDAWREAGEALKSYRLGSGVYTQRAVELLGVSSVTLVKAEKGIIDPEPLMKKLKVVLL